MVLIPSPPGISEMPSVLLSHKVLQGACYQDAMVNNCYLYKDLIMIIILLHSYQHDIKKIKRSFYPNRIFFCLFNWYVYIFHSSAVSHGFICFTIDCTSEIHVASYDIWNSWMQQLIKKWIWYFVSTEVVDMGSRSCISWGLQCSKSCMWEATGNFICRYQNRFNQGLCISNCIMWL